MALKAGRHTALASSAAIDWPTLALAAGIYVGWALLTLAHEAIPRVLLPIAGGWLIAWQGSLQHETIHGRPTPWPWFNRAIGSAPISLWLPYERYRRSHLAHHASPELTDPAFDPESRYVGAPLGAVARLSLISASLQASLLGRLLLGPWLTIGGFLIGEAGRLLRAEPEAWSIWIRHAAAGACILVWLNWCGLGAIEYMLCFVYPGAALTLLRSFAEHRAAPAHEHRAAIVENAPVLGFLFLYNNLHVVHHARSDLAWWRLPRLYARNRDAFLQANGGLVYAGYGDVARRYLLRPHDVLVHPDHASFPGRL